MIRGTHLFIWTAAYLQHPRLDMSKFEATFSWATPIINAYNPEHAAIKPGLSAYSYEIEKSTRERGPIASGVAPRAKQGLYESPFDLFRADVAEVKALAHFCTQALGQVITRLHDRAARPETPPLGQFFIDMFESWVHITRDGGFHDGHIHPNCSWCGIYYVDIGDATVEPPNGCNRFYPPVMQTYDDLGTQVLKFEPMQAIPEEGKLIIFPSYVRHSAVPYHGKRDRIIASFNARVRQA